MAIMRLLSPIGAVAVPFGRRQLLVQLRSFETCTPLVLLFADPLTAGRTVSLFVVSRIDLFYYFIYLDFTAAGLLQVCSN
jgi:hypothetical protein